MRRAGFTLLEILIVLAVLGIVFSIGFVNLRGWVLSNSLQEGASQVGADLERLRSSAWRNNTDGILRVGAGGSSYTLILSGSSSVQTLPSGVSVSAGSTGDITYTAPYGELGEATSRELTLNVAGDSSRELKLYLVGVTGKVIR
jgi:prepilin-type N-terminal cleavage/methylation domain-containing protein